MDKEQLKEEIINVLKTIYDPEIPVNIYELGLIYNIEINDNKRVSIQMTLTSPACPVAGSMPIEIENKLYSIPEVDYAEVKVVWEPPWNQEMMSEVARLELGLF